MNQVLLKRLAYDLVILISVANGWWFFVIIAGLASSWLFPFFIEIIIAGFIYDSLFGFADSLGIVGYIGTLVSIFIFIISACLRKILRR